MTRDMTRLDLAELREIVADEPYPLVFATVSGAHLYGFPSRDSDVDLRGAHLLPAAEVVGLRHGPQTLDRMWTRRGAEIDLVTHDLVKFCRLLTGIAPMRTGRVQAHLPTLLAEVPQAPAYLSTLMRAKASGEHARLASVPDAPGPELIEADLARLRVVLDEAATESTLPDRPTAEPALHDLIVRTRLAA